MALAASRMNLDPVASIDAVLPLVRSAQQGDQRAFERLYRLHVGRILALARRLAVEYDRAEELTQDVFVKVWERLHTFRGESLFSTWLHRLAVNLILSDRRAVFRRSRRFTSSDDLEALAPAARSSNPADRLDLERAIERLPPGARTVFVLHDIEGFEHAEIADLTGIAAGTSKAQLFRARRLLREALTA